MKQIVIATANAHKLQEYQSLLEHLKVEIFSLRDFDIGYIEETGETFFDNAKIKALAVRKVTNSLIIADDSGLEVFALDNKPGIHSRRFSKAATDASNNKLLLEKMASKADRSARFVTAVCLIDEAGNINRFEGELHGYIHTACEGKHGFGYDPLFIPVGYTKTLAEMDQTEKNKISHRGRCLRKVLAFLEDLD